MARDRLPWFRIGCLSIIVLPVLLVLLVVGVARVAPRGDTVERQWVRELPAVEDLPAADVPGRVQLDVSGAELLLSAAPPGSPLTVTAIYEDRSVQVLESYEPGAGPGVGWTYRVVFDGADDSFLGFVTSMAGSSYPQIAVAIPRGTPLALEVSLTQGGGSIDLGGLWLSTFELTVQRGGLGLDVSEPLPEPMQRFESTGAMGGIEFKALGNASPGRMEISQRMGGIEVDLGGQWRQDARIDIALSMGGGAVRVPDNVRVTGVAARDSDAPLEGGGDLPILTINTSVSMGELEVVHDN